MVLRPSLAKSLCVTATLLAVVALLAAGCAGTTGVEATRRAEVVSAEGDLAYVNRLVVNNPGLSRAVEIVDIQHRDIGGLLQENVTLLNQKKKTLQIKYQFRWYDEQGMAVESEAQAWTPLIIYGKETKMVQGVAPNPTATDFKIQIMAQ